MHLMRCLTVAACALGAAASAPAFAPDVPSRAYRDPVHKYSFKMYPKWEQVPVEITEKYSVAKFYEKGERGDWFSPEIEVFRIDHRNQGQAPTTGPEPDSGKVDLEKIRQMVEAERAPKSTFDLAFGSLIVPNGQKPCDPAAFAKITSYDKVAGKLWIHEISRGNNPKDKTETLLAMLAAFEKDGVEYGIRMTGPARRRKEFEPAFKTMAKSFVFFDDKAKDVVSNLDDLLAGVNLTAKRRGEIEKGMVKGWGVEVSSKKNYVIIYNTKKGENAALARTIAKRIESIREQVYEVQFPPSEPIKAVSIVRVCADRNEYHRYGGPGGSAGYWNSWAEELVFYDASAKKKEDDDTLAVLYHEAFHQYIFYSVGNFSPHSWFNEGHGDYYAGSRNAASKWRIEPFDWRVGTVKGAVVQGPRPFTLQKDEKSGKERRVYSNERGYTPLKDLVGFSQGDYYSYPGVSYAQGWSLIYFLREEVPKNKKMNEKWGKILDLYFNALKREVSKEGRLRRGGLEDPPKPDGPTTPDGPDEPGEPDDPADPAEPDDPAKPDDPTGPGADEPPADPGFQPMQQGEASESALDIALREAFAGVNFDELEAAWKEFVKKV